MISILREQKKKRRRNRINKRWTSEEIRWILNYLENSTQIEVPTAQIYYRKFISETGINATWDLIRWKVKHLKNTYKKAMDWRSSPEASSLECNEGTESVNARVMKICPQFHQLNNIFGEKMRTQVSWQEFVDNGELIETSAIKIDVDDVEEESDTFKVGLNNESSTSNYCADTQNGPTNPIKNILFDKRSSFSAQKNSSSNSLRHTSKEFPNVIKETDPKSTFSYLADYQAQKTILFKMKLEWERQKHTEGMEINRNKIALEQQRIKAEIELKKQELELKARDIERKYALQAERTKAEFNFKTRELELREREIERDERLKVLEIEKNERLQKFEIEMKLKYQNKQI